MAGAFRAVKARIVPDLAGLAPSAGTRLGPIGKGGMGEMYRARDTRGAAKWPSRFPADRFSDRFSHRDLTARREQFPDEDWRSRNIL